jgi:hypothetical protein
LLLRELKFVNEALESVGLLDGVEIFALKIFDQRHFERKIFGYVAQNDWNAVHVGALRGAPATFAGDELVAAVNFADDERLDDAARLDRAGEFVKSLFAEAGARLIWAWIDQIDIDVKEAFTEGRGCRCPRRRPLGVSGR